MKSKISIFALSFATVCMISSCLGSDDDTETVYYDDAAISNISIVKLNNYYTIKAKDGVTDSMVMKALSVNGYGISVNQYSGTITNAPDSFPIGTDLKHVLISVSAVNGGVPLIKSMVSDSLFYINSTDSLDFSVPRDIVVYSTSAYSKATSPLYIPGTPGTRKYTVNFVVHQEYADSFKWNKLDIDNDIKNYKSVKAGICNNNLVVLGKTANGAELKTLVNGSWKKVKTFSANATMTTDGNVVYVTDGGMIYSSSDVTNWHVVSADVKNILGVCGNEMFAMSNGNKVMVSLDNGATWTNDNIDEDAKYLPSSDFNFISTTTATNADVKRAFIIGNSSANSTKAVVWSKIVEDNAAKDQVWMYQAFNGSNLYYLPKLSNLSVVNYNGNNLLAIGGDFDKMYYSVDCGITWREDDRFMLPDGFSASGASMTVDADNNIWIVCTGTGQVWKGRLNELGWK